MISAFKHELKSTFFAKFLISFFLLLSVWWLTIFIRGLTSGLENNAFTLIYPFFSLFGGIFGLYAGKQWGGFGSVFGKAISFFAIGLLLQFFGQASYAYLIYVKNIPFPYPSIGDVGYFGSVIFYIIGIFFVGLVVGIKFRLRSFFGKSQALIIPLILLAFSYFFFLRGYTFDPSQNIKTILDFGYPLGQAFYVSLAILILLFSRNVLGGIMKGPITFLLVTLVFQYFCDFMFLYQVNRGSWYVSGVNDYMYFVSYFLMTSALIYINSTFKEIIQDQN